MTIIANNSIVLVEVHIKNAKGGYPVEICAQSGHIAQVSNNNKKSTTTLIVGVFLVQVNPRRTNADKTQSKLLASHDCIFYNDTIEYTTLYPAIPHYTPL